MTVFPRGPLPSKYPRVVPELLIEVRSPGDRWGQVLAKVAEYLQAGVPTVLVLDPEPRTAHLFSTDQAVRVLKADDELTLPAPLDGFRALVRRFFE
jgi:Uma2 family endonuclease